jgi:hypothetical protein
MTVVAILNAKYFNIDLGDLSPSYGGKICSILLTNQVPDKISEEPVCRRQGISKRIHNGRIIGIVHYCRSKSTY